MAHRTQENSLLTLLNKDMIKDTDEHPDGGDAQGKVCGKDRRARVPSLSMPLSQHLHVFGNSEALWTPYCWDFYGNVIT